MADVWLTAMTFTFALPREVPISQQKVLTFISLYSLSLVAPVEKAEQTTGGGWYGRSMVQQKRAGGRGAPQPAQLVAEQNENFRPTHQNYRIMLNTSFLGGTA